MECNHNCFACEYVDCICDDYTDDLKLDLELDREAKSNNSSTYTEAQKRYYRSEKGKANIHRKNTNEAGKERMRRYNSSEKGKARYKRFNQTPHRKEYMREYNKKYYMAHKLDKQEEYNKCQN